MLRDPGVRRHARALRYAHAVRHVADIDREAGSKEKAETGYADAMAVYRGEPGASKLDVANALRGYALLRQERGGRDQRERDVGRGAQAVRRGRSKSRRG